MDMDRTMGNEEKTYIKEMVAKYQADVDKLAAYLPWLTEKRGIEVKQLFDNPDIVKSSVVFPIYDQMTMGFIRTAQETIFMNENYVYTFSRNQLRTTRDEHSFIEQCSALRDLPDLGNILAKYILGGATKASLWSEGVKNGVCLEAIKRMQEIIKLYR